MPLSIISVSILILVGFLIVFFFLFVVRYIPNNRVGIVEKLISGSGSIQSGLIALRGEAGFQPKVVRGGWHFFMPFQYRIHKVPLVTVPQGKIGYIFARDGRDLLSDQSLACNVTANDVQNVEAFLTSGGQKGPQRMVLREGTYAVNLAQFVVLTEDRLYYLPLDSNEEQLFGRMAGIIGERDGFRPVIVEGNRDEIGVITIQDGPSLPAGEIIAPEVGSDVQQEATYHNNFQDADKFLLAGGKRGRQLQTLVEGTYYINRLFATVERVAKTVIEIGTVGVVVSYTGATGRDLTGESYKHGELVETGQRGVWSTPLLPGKYAFNVYAGNVIVVPTTNFILKWHKDAMGSHRFDENLAEVSLITKDAFEPNLPLSVVVHIDYRKAPWVIQRFGDIKRLVEQTLDPMVAAYFKNVGQTRTVIELLQDRAAIQQISGQEMREKFSTYNLELQEVLIGTPTSGGSGQIEQILTQLRARQVAAEQIETYTRQERASVKERELREAEERAKIQTQLTQSEMSISIQSNEGKADYARAQQQAAQIQVLAQAEAEKISIIAEGEAKKIKALAEAQAEKAARIGVGQAIAIEEQVRAYGGPQFQLIQRIMERFAEAIETSKVDVVPKIQFSGGAGGASSGNALEGLLTVLLSERMMSMTGETPVLGERDVLTQQLRADLQRTIKDAKSSSGSSHT